MNFTQSILSPAEAEIMVRQLKPMGVDQIGTEEWKQQRVLVEKLNMCSHANAALKKDDFVKSFLVEHEQLPTLLHEVLVMELWRNRVLPGCFSEMESSPTATYLYCQYEGVLMNLLECIMFHEEVVVAFGDDVLEVIDYCWRQVAALFADKHISEAEPAISAASINDTPEVQLRRQLRAGGITRAMSCLSCLWFVIDRMAELPMAATNSILKKNDLPMGLAEVMLLQPWQRRDRTRGVTQKYVNNAFVDVQGDDALRVCIPEAHTWFALHKLLCDPDCRTQYSYTKHRKDIIVNIRRFLNDAVVDQIPALANVQRALEELTFIAPPTGTEEKFKSSLVIEPVPRLLAAIDSKATDWTRLTSRFAHMLRDPRVVMEDAQRVAALFDTMFAEITDPDSSAKSSGKALMAR